MSLPATDLGGNPQADAQMEAANEYVGRFLPEVQRRLKVLLKKW